MKKMMPARVTVPYIAIVMAMALSACAATYKVKKPDERIAINKLLIGKKATIQKKDGVTVEGCVSIPSDAMTIYLRLPDCLPSARTVSINTMDIARFEQPRENFLVSVLDSLVGLIIWPLVLLTGE
jgi:hypothetical protein